jgi:hypothetical protein
MTILALVLATFLGVAPTVAVAAASAGGTDCEKSERYFVDQLSLLPVAMEPSGARRAIATGAAEAAGRCLGSEGLAYVRVRAAELDVDSTRIDDGDAKRALASRLATDVLGRFPKSARIATVRARLVGTVEAARGAVAIDAGYVPAKVALASALEESDATAAQEILGKTGELALVDDGFAVLARVRWRLGDANGAAAAARKQLTGRKAIRIEPGGGDTRANAAAQTILAQTLAKKGQTDKAARLLIDAEPYSSAAHGLMESADPTLRRAIVRVRRSTAAAQSP